MRKQSFSRLGFLLLFLCLYLAGDSLPGGVLPAAPAAVRT